jgi:lipopolysaccharide export LptBFGC system permease protein LptF
MPSLLLRYIFREMGKTFALAAIGLSGVMVLGGGVFNMVKAVEVSPGQFLRLVAILGPLSAALALPVAALYSAALTYGRLSADNEFVACRSGGINVHVLLLPAVGLSVISAVVTFALINFVVPRMTGSLNEMVVRDLGRLFQQQLRRPRGLTFADKYLFRTDRPAEYDADSRRVLLGDVVFAERLKDEWVRYGTCRRVEISYDVRADEVILSARVHGLSFFDRHEGRVVVGEDQVFQNLPWPLPRRVRVKFLDLPGLLYYRAHPEEWPEVRAEVSLVRAELARLIVTERLLAELQAEGRIVLSDGGGRYEFRAAPPFRASDDRAPLELDEVTIQEQRPGGGGPREGRAARVTFEVLDAASAERIAVAAEAQDVTMSDGQSEVHKARMRFGPVAVKEATRVDLAAISDAELLDPRSVTSAVQIPAIARKRVLGERDETYRKVSATIHERIAFSGSVIGLVLLAAALGIVFRNAHVLTAFGISFVPLLFVILAIVTGKQLAQHGGTFEAGLAVIWSGLGVVALMDVAVLARVVRR